MGRAPGKVLEMHSLGRSLGWNQACVKQRDPEVLETGNGGEDNGEGRGCWL